MADQSRRELGAFLRSRRERLAPADVGLPALGRRRTPGLRREELEASVASDPPVASRRPADRAA